MLLSISVVLPTTLKVTKFTLARILMVILVVAVRLVEDVTFAKIVIVVSYCNKEVVALSIVMFLS